MNMDDVRRLLAPLSSRIRLLVGRCVLSAVNDSSGIQEMQAQVLAGETREGLERVQDYGITSVPLPGAEGVALFVGGNRDHGFVIKVDDRRYRIHPLEQGEVALYTVDDQEDHGHRIVLKRGGVVEVQGDILNLRGETRVRISGDEVEIHADTRLETDVAGYGEALNFVGGTTWHTDTYHDGATFDTSEDHGIQPPEVD